VGKLREGGSRQRSGRRRAVGEREAATGLGEREAKAPAVPYGAGESEILGGDGCTVH
jgi:hypothetical protein